METKLDCFVGDWRMAGRIDPGRFGPGGPSEGTTTYRWELGGKWLTFDSHMTIPGMGIYEVRGGVAYDAQAGVYRSFAFNNMGNLIIYDGQWVNDTLVFTATYPNTSGKARVSYKLLPDGTIRMASETSADGATYETYFETVLSRA